MNDLKPFAHGSEGTHHACMRKVLELGAKVGCCQCNGHDCKVWEDFKKEGEVSVK